MNYQLSNKKQEKGQGLVEYALILVLVAIVVIASLSALGPRVGSIFSRITTSLNSVTVIPYTSMGSACASLGASSGQTIYFNFTNNTASTSTAGGHITPLTC